MGNNWPAFITKDLGDSDADAAELERRWTAYRREMDALIAAGGVHQDADGWWIDDATGELIGPDPELERPLTLTDAGQFRTIDEMLPELAAKMRGRGPQKPPKKVATTIRLSPDVIAHYRATGRGWQTRIDDDLRKILGGH